MIVGVKERAGGGRLPRWRGLAGTVLVLGLTLSAAFAALAAAPVDAAASVYYVSTTGSNTNSGTSVSSAFATIAQALSVAPAGSTILVEPGTYTLTSPVLVTQTVTLESDAANGGNAANTILDATGLPNAVVIEGPGAAGTVVAGLTMENAQKAGLVAISTSDLTLSGNVVQNNDQSCAGYTNCNNPGSNNGIPPGVPGSNVPSGGTAFTATDSIPCGNTLSGGSDCEALHLIGVTHSVVQDNTVQNNLDGGIYLTDEAGPTSDNLVIGNTVTGNQVDCGITLASHVPNHGVVDNTIVDNVSTRNGAAGIIMATPVPGGIVSGNVVSGNTVMDNGLGGIDLHTHVAGSTVSDNVVTHNTIGGNGPDIPVTMNPSTHQFEPTGISIGAVGSPIVGTVVTGNELSDEVYGIYVSLDTPGTVVAGDRSQGNVSTLVFMLTPPPPTVEFELTHHPVGFFGANFVALQVLADHALMGQPTPTLFALTHHPVGFYGTADIVLQQEADMLAGGGIVSLSMHVML
jgi:parallel beta-helix repeat protein